MRSARIVGLVAAAALYGTGSASARSRRAQQHGWAAGTLPEPLSASPACDGIDRVHASTLTAASFREKYLSPGKPLVVLGATAGWKAHKNWRKRSFLNKYGHLWMKSSNASDLVLAAGGWHHHRESKKTRIWNFVDELGTQAEQGAGTSIDRPFVFDSKDAFGPGSNLRDDFVTPAALHPFFNSDADRPAGLPRMWPVLSIGTDGAGLPFHNHGDSWLAVVHGTKHWFLYRESPPLTGASISLGGARHWAQKVLPTLMPEQKPLQCTQKAGELLFVPQGWAHATLNMGEAIAVGQQLEWLPVQREERARTVLADHSVRARSSPLAARRVLILSHGRGSAQTRLTRAAFPACTG
jgi:hypothetical protein